MSPAFTRKLLATLLAGRKPSAAGAPKRRLKLCLFKLDGIGDFVLALGAVRYLLAKYGEEQCALVLSAPAAQLARREFPRATVLGFTQYTGGAKSILGLYRDQSAQMRGLSFETLVSLRNQRTTLHHLSLSWIAADRSLGIANTSRLSDQDKKIFQFPLTEILPDLTQFPPGYSRELERHRVLLQHLCQEEISIGAILPRFIAYTPSNGQDIIVTPFSSDPLKDLSQEKMAAVLQEISREVDAPIHLCGGPVEEMRLNSLAAALQSLGVAHASVVISKDLVDFAQRIAASRAVLTVDTSTAHIAIALDKPAVILIGGGLYGEFGPWQRSAKQRWLTNHLPCFECNWRCIYPEIRCLSDIPTSTIARAVVEAWRSAT
jgi:ADP-heptose:LPS heptosyltransferase